MDKNNQYAVFFDLDGTLVDTAPDMAYALNRIREEEGQPGGADGEGVRAPPAPGDSPQRGPPPGHDSE